MLGVNEGGGAAGLLGLGHRVQRSVVLPRIPAVDLDDAARGSPPTPSAKSAAGSRWDDLPPASCGGVAQLHHRALAKVLLYLASATSSAFLRSSPILRTRCPFPSFCRGHPIHALPVFLPTIPQTGRGPSGPRGILQKNEHMFGFSRRAGLGERRSVPAGVRRAEALAWRGGDGMGRMTKGFCR